MPASFRAVFPAIAAAALLAAAVPVRHAGPDRARIAYAEEYAAEKKALLARINSERAAAGAPPVAYDLVGAKAGDDFCREQALRGYTGHWDLSGRPPYLRYAEAGGVDYHAENVASRRRIGGPLEEGVGTLLLEAHRLMMEEKPPHDAHRRTILDPVFTHVGIGAALAGSEFRMTEEFSRHVADWVEVPAAPERAGGTGAFAAKLPPGWSVGAVGIAYEAPPRPMSPREIEAREQYGYPPEVRELRPLLPRGQHWSDGSSGDFTTSAGRLSLTVPLDRGPGSYYVLVFAGPGSISGRRLSPVTAARIEAR